MAAGAKLQKSFEDYFRIPILLRPLGNTSQQTLNQIATIFNQIDRFPINEDYTSTKSQQLSISKQKIKKNQQLYERIKADMQKRNNYQSHKLLFLSQDFQNDWSQFQIVYRVSFVILVFSAQQGQSKQQNGPYRNSDTSVSSSGELNEKINKINLRLKQKDKQLLGIIFLNDNLQYSKSLTPGLRFTIVPGSLPLEQLAMFIQPWVMDLIPLIEKNFLQHILECKWQENSIIVFNRSQEKSQPKIMKKKKKFRCLKICGDLGLMLHLYKFAYENYHQAQEQLRKVDDWMWVLGCIQGKLACMTCNAQLHIKEQDLSRQIEQLIEQSTIISKKVRQQSFEVQNTFKILKLLLHQDKQRFDEMIESTLSNSKGLTEEQKFFYYSFIGSMYEKANMQRKRNYYFFKAALIIQKFKPQVSQLLLKTIKQSKYIKDWQQLNSKLIHKIIQNQSYFNPDAEFHLQLLQNCTHVLNPQEIQNIHDYLNYGRFEKRVIDTNQQKIFQVKEFSIEESLIKPKLNRLVTDQSPQKPNKSGVFVGWKKKLTYLYEEDEPILFKGTILNNLPFEIRLNVFIDLVDFPENVPEFSVILPPSIPFKFNKPISFSLCQKPITIKKIRFQMWNFILYKTIDPEICFELYEKQPQLHLQIQGAQPVSQQNDRFKIQIQESSFMSLRCILKKINLIQCSVLRITCSVYYDIDVGFQQNQFIFTLQNNFNNLNFTSETKLPNLKFLETEQKQSSLSFNQNQNILVLKLKKFKASRDHLKKVEINLDYIRQKSSKYQFNKQYVVEPKFVNSVWAQVVEISTPQLENSMENLKSLSLNQIQQFRKNWNTIENTFLAKIKFLKDKVNLKPFKVWYDLQDKSSDGKVLGVNEAILSNLTEGQMWIQLDKIKLCSKEKQKILNSSEENQTENKRLSKTLKFRWQNVVNKNMQGVINLKIQRNPLIFRPKLQFQVRIQKIEEENSLNCRNYKLFYTIRSENGEEIRPHKVTIKAQSQTQLGPEINQASQTNQIESNANNDSGTSNASILIKGKTKINKIPKRMLPRTINNKANEENQDFEQKLINYFSNNLTLKVIKQRTHESNNMQKDLQMSIVVTIQFDEKQIGKWQQVVQLS